MPAFLTAAHINCRLFWVLRRVEIIIPTPEMGRSRPSETLGRFITSTRRSSKKKLCHEQFYPLLCIVVAVERGLSLEVKVKKEIPLHAMEALGVKEGIAPTHT
jgi:hypothetical protein